MTPDEFYEGVVNGAFDESEVSAYLMRVMTPQQRAFLSSLKLDVPMVMNGRFDGRLTARVEGWARSVNATLGFEFFFPTPTPVGIHKPADMLASITGLCVNCGKNPPIGGGTPICQPCVDSFPKDSPIPLPEVIAGYNRVLGRSAPPGATAAGPMVGGPAGVLPPVPPAGIPEDVFLAQKVARAELAAALSGAAGMQETQAGLAFREGEGANAQKKPVSKHVIQVDRWGERRGHEIAEAWKTTMAPVPEAEDDDDVPATAPVATGIDMDPVLVADAHASLFNYEPKLAEQPADQARAAWWKQLMETPEFQALRAKTMLDEGMSELGSKSLCDQWVAYVAENPEPPKPNESIGDTMKRMQSCSKALNGAFEDVTAAQDTAAGLGLGDQNGQINPKDLVSYFNRIKNDEFLRQLMKMAGRMRTLAQTLQRTKTQHGRDDTVGVELGGDVARLVPSELAQLACGVPELELLALDRLARGQAMCRKYRAKEPLGKGPIVVVVDESGSMGGDPIMTAKALALALAWVARQQKRWIAMVGFSGGTEGYRVAFPPGDMDQDVLIDWLTHFYSGGTTLDVPLAEIPFVYWPEFMAKGMQRGRTDVILITDAQVNAPADMIANYVEWAKAEQVRTYGIVIGQSNAGDIAQFATRHWCVPDLGNAEAAIETLLSI